MGVRRTPKKLDLEELWNYALKVLGQRAHSAVELKGKLAKRAASAADVMHTMRKLQEYGLTDDKKFSEAFAASRLQNQSQGRFRVLRDLRARRVTQNVAAGAVEKVYAGIDESGLIEEFLQRKYRNIDLTTYLKDQKKLASAYRRLRMAGFSSGATLSVLKRYAALVEEWSEPLEGEE
jgi:regulatory protein